MQKTGRRTRRMLAIGPFVLLAGVGLTGCPQPPGGGGGDTTTTAPTTTAGPTTTVPGGGGCEDYTPTNLAVGAPSVGAGGSVTVSGTATPNDTITVSISGNSQPTTVLGTTNADGSGNFITLVTIPGGFPTGTYTLEVSSPQCSTPGTISINVI